MNRAMEFESVVTPIESETGQIQGSLSVVVITNRPRNFDVFIKQFSNTNLTFIIVTDPDHFDEFLKRNYRNVKVIWSKSRNFSYLVNLCARYVSTSHFIDLGDDEILEGNLGNLLKCDLKEEAYSIFIKTFFGDEEIKMWSHFAPRILARTVRFKRRVHEIPVIEHYDKIINEVQIKNVSYADWSEYWRKAKSYTKREQKSLRRFVEISVSPVYRYFVNGKCSNGLLGIKIVFASMIYAVLTLKCGINGHQYFQLSHLEQLYNLERDHMCAEEREYLGEKIELLKKSTWSSQDDIAEEMEQLSSAL